MKFCVALVLAMSVACGGASPRVKYYDLSRPQRPEFRTSATGPVVTFEGISAAPGLDGDQIAIRSLDGNIQHYLYHRWHAPIPLLVNDLLAEVFAASGRFRRVDINNRDKDAELVVTGRILRFEGMRRRADTSIARVAIVLSAHSPATGATLLTELYSRDLAITEHSVGALAATLREAVQSIAEQAARELATSSPPKG